MDLYPLSGKAASDDMATDSEVDNAIASHLAASNPHLITPTLIGAAPTSHTHTGAQITGNISGSAANITGIAAIANGGTGASTSLQALINLGISINTNLINIRSAKIGWGISDNIWQDYGMLNTIFKDINTSSAGFTKTPTYFTSLYGSSYHWSIVGANAIYTPTNNGFSVYLIIPSYPHTNIGTNPASLTAAYAAANNYRIAWVGIQD